MSRRELERLVDDAESDADMRAQLRRCRSREELILMARRLGYLLTGRDLLRSWWEHSRELRTRARTRVESSGTLVHQEG